MSANARLVHVWEEEPADLATMHYPQLDGGRPGETDRPTGGKASPRMPVAAWAVAEVGGAALGDRRRTRRLVTLLGDLAARSDADVPAAGATPALAGAGPLAHPAQAGLWVHSVLAVSGDGVPLGLLHQRVRARDPAATGSAPPGGNGRRRPRRASAGSTRRRRRRRSCRRAWWW